jgi:hypothetical protein
VGKKKKKTQFSFKLGRRNFFSIQFIKLVDTVTKHKTLDRGALQEKQERLEKLTWGVGEVTFNA